MASIASRAGSKTATASGTARSARAFKAARRPALSGAASPAGDRRHGVRAAPADHLGDALAQAAELERVARDLGKGAQQGDDVALRRVRVDAEEQVRRGEREEVDGVRVDDRGAVERLAQQVRRRGRGDAEDLVDCPRRGQMVGLRSSAADARRHRRHHLDLHAGQEGLEAAEVHHLEARRRRRGRRRRCSTSTRAWPSMRVTGSMVRVRVILEPLSRLAAESTS